MKSLYVFNPDTKSIVPAEQWLKEPDPTRAQLFGFKSGDGVLLMTKTPIAYNVTFDKAQALAAKYRYEDTGMEFRCITRREVNDYQDALDDGLLDLVKAIGGETEWGWIWTSEADRKDGWFARRNSVGYAWIFYSTYGYLNHYYVINAYRCQAVTLCRLD